MFFWHRMACPRPVADVLVCWSTAERCDAENSLDGNPCAVLSGCGIRGGSWRFEKGRS